MNAHRVRRVDETPGVGVEEGGGEAAAGDGHEVGGDCGGAEYTYFSAAPPPRCRVTAAMARQPRPVPPPPRRSPTVAFRKEKTKKE